MKMPYCELAVSKKIDHFNNRSWFVVKELESGETLEDVDSLIQAEELMLNIICKEPSVYFTSQEVTHI